MAVCEKTGPVMLGEGDEFSEQPSGSVKNGSAFFSDPVGVHNGRCEREWHRPLFFLG